MPQRNHGIGMPSTVTLAKTAYLASWASAAGHIAKNRPHLADDMGALNQLHQDNPPAPTHDYANTLLNQITYCRDELGLKDMLQEQMDFTRLVERERDAPKNATLTWQKRFAAAEAARAKEHIKEAVDNAVPTMEPDAALAHKVWHNSLSLDGRADFLHDMACAWVKPLSNPALEFAARRLLRLPLRGCSGKCACGMDLDPFGDHADSCPLLNAKRTTRHNAVNQFGLMAPASQAGLLPRAEQTGLVTNNGRPADTCITQDLGFGQGVAACYDVVGVGSCAKTYIKKAAGKPGEGMEPAVARKTNQTRKIRSILYVLLVFPMAFESHGGLHPNWRKTYIRWAEFWASKDPEKRTRDIQGLMVRSWMARVSHIIQMEQYKQYEYMLTCASNFKHGNVPHLLRTAIPEDFDRALAAIPPFEV
jgi:hypothetical protein